MIIVSTSKDKHTSFMESLPKEQIFVSFEEFCPGTNYAKQYLTIEQEKALNRILRKELRSRPK